MIILVPNTAGSGNLVMIIHNIYFGLKGFKGSKLLNSDGVRLSSSSIYNLQSSVFNLEMQIISRTHCNKEVGDDDEDDSEADVEEAWEGEGRRSARPRKGEPASTHS